MKIIELYGLPGCGKTTLCNFIKREKGELLYTNADLNKNYKNINILLKNIYIFFYPRNIIFFVLIIYLGFIYKSRIYAICKILYLYIILFIHKRSKDEVNVILDSGIVQNISSLSNDLRFNNELCLYKLLKCFCREFEIIEIECELSVEETIKRVKKRNRKDIWLENIDSKQLYFIKQYNLNFLKKYLTETNYKLNMSKSPEALYKEICKVFI